MGASPEGYGSSFTTITRKKERPCRGLRLRLSTAASFNFGDGSFSAAAEEPSESETPSELALEGVERLMRALEALIDSIPQYEMPEINEHGDIIIRRKRQPAPDELDDEDIEQTRT